MIDKKKKIKEKMTADAHMKGEIRGDALNNIREAIIGYLETFPEEKELIIKAREVVDITV